MAKRGKLALTDEVQRDLLDTYEKTGSLKLGARVAGISHRTIYNWIRQAERDGEDSPQWAFVVEMRKSRAKWVKRLYERHDAMSVEDVRAVEWSIDRYEKNEISSEPVQEAWADLTDDEAIEEVAKDPRIIAAVLKAQGLSAPETTKARELPAMGDGGNNG